jgi:hypothetical protein
MPWDDRTLAAGALALNDQQHGDDDKINSVDPYMLAAYCFDLTRKLHYLYVAFRLAMEQREPSFTGEYQGVRSPEELAGKILADTQEVETAARDAAERCPDYWTRSRDWEVRARTLEDIIVRQWQAIHEDHEGLFGFLLGDGARDIEYTPEPEPAPRRERTERPGFGRFAK